MYFNEGAAGASQWHDSGTYTYNKSQNTLAFTITNRSSKGSIYYTKLFIVQSVSSGQIVLINSSDGSVTTLRKKK